MGLAEPKNKQRITADPQNKRWKDDKNAIGFKLLGKMGWTDGTGLGKDNQGRTTNLKVALKQNNFGVGADARTSDNWLENTFAFDDLLKGLDNQNDNDTTVFIPTETESPSSVNLMGGRHSHRAKFVRNKQVSNYDQSQINNILGKKSDGQVQAHVDITKDTESTSKMSATIIDGVKVEVKKVAIADYFAQKMAKKGLNFGQLRTAPTRDAYVPEDEDVPMQPSFESKSDIIAQNDDVEMSETKTEQSTDDEITVAVEKTTKVKKQKSEKKSSKKSSKSDDKVSKKNKEKKATKVDIMDESIDTKTESKKAKKSKKDSNTVSDLLKKKSKSDRVSKKSKSEKESKTSKSHKSSKKSKSEKSKDLIN